MGNNENPTMKMVVANNNDKLKIPNISQIKPIFLIFLKWQKI